MLRRASQQITAGRKVIRISFVAAIAAIVLVSLSPTASATPTTPNPVPQPALAIGICSGNTNGVTVDATHITWLGGTTTTGCTQTGSPTDIVYSGATLLPGVQGTIKDLVLGVTTLPLADFMDFVVNGATLHLSLTQLGPGPINTACPNSTDINGSVCAVFPGSVFTLSPTGAGTEVILPAQGIMSDSTGSVGYAGQFSASFPGTTPFQLQQLLCPSGALPCTGGASVTTTYSGTFALFHISTGCPATKGFWKHHSFPATLVFPVTLGGVQYSQADFASILSAPGAGNAVNIMGSQLVAAVLNIAAGAQTNAGILSAITQAQTLLQFGLPGGAASFPINMTTGDVPASSPLGQAMLSVESTLDSYNNGFFGTCQDGTGLSVGK
jgi:hypothetical protein